jgi:hypothetical protein
MRYVANMLFQYRVVPDVRKRRTCEKRLVVFKAESPDEAFRRALRFGKARQHRYRNVSGGMVYVEFLGLIDLLELDSVCQPDEVWYSMFATTNPRRLITPTKKLAVFMDVPGNIGAAIWAAPALPQSRRRKP